MWVEEAEKEVEKQINGSKATFDGGTDSFSTGTEYRCKQRHVFNMGFVCDWYFHNFIKCTTRFGTTEFHAMYTQYEISNTKIQVFIY